MAIASLADGGARAFHAADLIDRKAPIDLFNDGHPQTVLRLDDSGTAHVPYLADRARQHIKGPQPDGYDDAVRWATEVSVLGVERRTWGVAWDAGRLDGTVALVAATDGTDTCRFHTTWQAPTLKLLPDAEPGRAGTYRALLAGRGSAPPTANLDPIAAQAASNLQGTWFSVPVQAPSWRVDLLNAGQVLRPIRVGVASGAGRGCDRNLLALVQDGKVTAGGLGRAWLPGRPPLAPASSALQQLLDQTECAGVTETPVIDQTRRTYVLLDNLAARPATVDRVRLLVAARGGIMRALARLSWKTHTTILPAGPA